MSERAPAPVTSIFNAIARGETGAAADLLPLVYSELRQLARARMAHLPPGNTLQPTALVHEAYLRLVADADPGWENRRHFFAAAAMAMRRILVEQARRKASIKHGGGLKRTDIDTSDIPIDPPREDVVALDEALTILAKEDPRKEQIVMLRYFAGLDREEVALALGISVRSVDREWKYVLAWLHKQMS